MKSLSKSFLSISNAGRSVSVFVRKGNIFSPVADSGPCLAPSGIARSAARRPFRVAGERRTVCPSGDRRVFTKGPTDAEYRRMHFDFGGRSLESLRSDPSRETRRQHRGQPRSFSRRTSLSRSGRARDPLLRNVFCGGAMADSKGLGSQKISSSIEILSGEKILIC